MADVELIDRKAMKNDIAVCCHESCGLYGGACCGVCGLIEKAPVVDAVPVVRCKDCRYCLFDLSGREYHLCMRVENNFPARKRRNADDFCSYGVRKNGA